MSDSTGHPNTVEGEEWVQIKELSEVSSTEPEHQPDSAVELEM